MADNETLLKDVRERFDHAFAEWKPIRDEGNADLRALSPVGTWSDKDRKDREEASRPCLSLDELTQYVNQLVNDARASKRAIEVNPEGTQSTDAQARFRANLIRQIEYRSNAQQAYTTMFQDTVQRSIGYLRISTRYVADRVEEPSAQSFEQEIRIEPMENPDLVTPDPWALKPDLSDMQYCFVREPWTHKEFTRRFPEAQVKDFTGAAQSEAGPQWIDTRRVWVAEYWAIEKKPRTLVLVADPATGSSERPIAFWRDTIPKGEQLTVLRERDVDQPYVCQRLTNGLEVLEKIDWPGKYIPIVACLGKVLWVDEGAGAKRQILSLIRLARHPQQLYNYYRTVEAEYIGGTPRVPYFAYEGSLAPREAKRLAESVQRPVPVIYVKPQIEGFAAGTPTPFPNRTPAVDGTVIQALSMGAEEARRAIQAAMGSGFLPTQAQRKNEKSGVALKQIETSAQKGSFHFIDHYEDAIRHCGVVINDLIPHIYDTARDLHVRKPDDTPVQVRINDPQAPPVKEYGEPIDTKAGEFDVTISTGPSYESEREKASEFADTLITARPEFFNLFGDLAVELKNLGPIGDVLVKRLKTLLPPQIREQEAGGQPDPLQLQQQLAQAQQFMQQAMAKIQELEQELAADKLKAQTTLAKTQADNETKLALEQIKAQLALALQEMKNAQQDKDREDTQQHELGMAGAEAAHTDQQAERQALMSLASAGPMMDDQPAMPMTDGGEA